MTGGKRSKSGTPQGGVIAASTELLPQLPLGARRAFRPNRCGSGEKCGLVPKLVNDSATHG